MRRGISSRTLRELLATIRDRVPGIAMRTTLIVGYPGETEKEFDELLAFVQEEKFHRLGVFTYSREEDTGAYGLGDPVSAGEKDRRRERIMEAQQEISLARNEAMIGTRVRVMIDRVEGDRWVGRTEHDAPEIDNEVYVESAHPLVPGTFTLVDIQNVSEYDAYGKA
jgi:ribosomal protein S12 methylthiotransferase